MTLTDWLSPADAMAMGGHETSLISRRAIFYPGEFDIGPYSRIDAGCILNGDVKIGERVHIAANCILYGKQGIHIGDYSVIGPFSVLHTEVDNFDGNSLCGVLWPQEKRRGSRFGRVSLGKFASLGTRVTVFAGVEIGEGAAIGAHSLVLAYCLPWTIYAGTPAKVIRQRSMKILEMV